MAVSVMVHAATPKSEGHDQWLDFNRNNIVLTEEVVPEKGTPYTFVVKSIAKSAFINIVPYDFIYKIVSDQTETRADGQVVNKTAFRTAPSAMGLIYHDLGEENHFCGLWVRSHYFRKDMSQYYIDSEIRLPDEIANIVIDYMAGEKESKLHGFSYLTTTSSALLPTEIAAGAGYGNGNRLK